MLEPGLLTLPWILLLLGACASASSSVGNGATASGRAGAGEPTGGGGLAATEGGGLAGNASGGAATSGAGHISYSTDFDLSESPLSEHGAWTHLGLDWTRVNSASGRAFGTHRGSGFDDSYARLSGFPPDVEVSVVIFLDGSIDSNYHEVEILLRWSDAAHDAQGYECNLNYAGGYAEIVRWNGRLGDYTYIGGGQGAGRGHKPVNGSIFKARIQGNLITTSLDGVVLQSADITAVGGAVWKNGDPGMGFYNGESGKYGLQSFSAVSL